MLIFRASTLSDVYKYKKVHKIILNWGRHNLRDFPWRKTSNPYKILLAEIMLHRTGASQVERVYESFLHKYPDLNSICGAGIEKIISDLSGLGLRWRAKLLYNMACIITKNHGNIPSNKKELMELPGIGHYISSAVVCFAFEKPEPILDTNTVRVIGRVSGLKITDSSRRSKKFEKIMFNMVNFGECKLFSLSLIDFAEAICKPRDPLCPQCPINDLCIYYESTCSECVKFY